LLDILNDLRARSYCAGKITFDIISFKRNLENWVLRIGVACPH
jgi:hypothetical protein